MAASRSAGRTISTTVLTRWKTLTLAPAEFIRRFLIHVLPKGFHRIRRYGLLANGNRVKAIAKVRELLAMEPGKEKSEKRTGEEDGPPKGRTCPCCASPMRIIEVIDRGCTPRHQPAPGTIRIDTSWADDHARQASSDRRRRQPPPWQRAGSSNLLAQTDADPPRLPQNARPYTRRWLRSRQQHPAQRPVVPITMIATAARAELQSPYRAWNRPSLTSRDFVRWRLLDADRRRTSPVYAPRRPTNLHTSRRCRGSKNTYSIV